MTVRFDVFFVEPFFGLDKSFTGKAQIAWVRSGIHSDRITGTRLDTKTAIDAAQSVDLVANRVFFNRIVRIFARLDINALGRTGSRAQKTSRALNRAVIFQGEAMPPAEGIRIRRSFIGILDGNRGLKFAG